MKKLLYTATALLILAGSAAPAASIHTSAPGAKPKPTTTEPTTEPGPSTSANPPGTYCDPRTNTNGCGLFAR